MLLDELIATSSAEIVNQKTLRCRSRAAVWRSSDDVNVKQIDRAAKGLEAASSSFAHNLLQESGEKRFFERMVVSTHPLSARGRDEFASIAEARGDAYVTELDSWVTKHTDPDESPKGRHFGVGVYFFEEPQSTEQSAGAWSPGSGFSAEGRKGSVQEIDVLDPPASLKRD